MVNTSEAWKKKFNQTLVPESFIEITCGITEPGVNSKTTVVSSTAAEFATTDSLTENDFTSFTKYGTGEPNLCVLDGSCEILPAATPYENAGFAGDTVVTDDSPDVIRFEVPSTITTSVPGVTVTWSSLFDEYATEFSVTSYLDTTALNTVSVTGNASVRSDIEIEMSGFNAVELKITKWCIPNHRARVEQFKIGRYLVFSKSNITSYSHTSSRDPISGQLPQDSISFSLDNSDRLWDSVNPQGIYKYIYERQPVTVRYGMDIDGKTEWVNGGIYFLSEWSVPSNSIEASFTARDAFLYLMSTTYTGRKYGTLYEMCYDALELLEADNITYKISEELKNYSTDISSSGTSYTNANILQLAANAAGMALYQTREGVIIIDYAYDFASSEDAQDIAVINNYSWPEITFSQNMLNVTTTVGNKTYAYPETPSGRGVSQTVSNAMLTEAILAKSRNALTESYSVLSNRRKATLSYRASPTTDALDFVKVHHQFGYDALLLLTNVSYTFNGCFEGSLEGYMIADVQTITLDYSDVTLNWSESVVLTANVNPASVDTPNIKWSASPEGIVSLHVLTNTSGKSTCHVMWNKPGEAVVTVSVNNISAACSFKTTEYQIKDLAVGDGYFYMRENGILTRFYVLTHNYESGLNGTGRTLVVRESPVKSGVWSSGGSNTRNCCGWGEVKSGSVFANNAISCVISAYLNGTYLSSLSADAKKWLSTTRYYAYTNTKQYNSTGTKTAMSSAVFTVSAAESVKGLSDGTVSDGSLLAYNARKRLEQIFTAYGRGIWTRTLGRDYSYRTSKDSDGDRDYFYYHGILLSGVSDSEWGVFSYTDSDALVEASYGYLPCFTLPGALHTTADGIVMDNDTGE